MSDAGRPTDDDALPDLFSGTPGWDGPLPDLVDPARGGRQDAGAGGGGGDLGSGRAGGAAGGPGARPASGADELPDLAGPAGGPAGPGLPDLGGPSAGAGLPDLAVPSDPAGLPGLGGPVVAAADLAGAADGQGLDDLTQRPRRARRARGSARAAREPTDRSRWRAEGAGAAGPTPGPRGAGRSGSVGPETAAPGAVGPEPTGRATGGLAGGLEPGTLFGPPDPPPGAGSRRGRRGGRRRRTEAGEGAASDSSAHGPERPLTAEERLQHALKLAYAHLTKRDRTVSEVRAHLEKREVDEPSITGALAELVEFGYLDDERYAARFVEDKRRLEGWGHLRIEQGLRRTGVPREVADRAVAEDPLRGDEDALAVDALEQRLNGRAPEDDRARQKALRLLATKGYPLDTAYAAVRAYERRCAEHDE